MARPIKYKTDKEKHVYRFYHNAKQRARQKNIPFDLTYEYLMSITTDECPVFKTPFIWGINRKGKGNAPNNSPSLDKIRPNRGYVMGNVAFISRRANKMKDDGTMREHYAIADWIWEQTHAKKKSTSPVSAGDNSKGEDNAKHRVIPTPWTGEDNNDSHHHCGTVSREDADHSTQASGADRLGLGSKKVGTFNSLKGEQDHGYSITKNPWSSD